MYKLADIEQIHFEVTNKCQAKCPMCPRRINGGQLNPWINLCEVSLQTFKSWFSTDFIKQLKSFYMCGNLGDPIIAKDTIPILSYLRSCNKNIDLRIHTNGSARDEEFWRNLANLKVKVIFGIDGLEDTHIKYRRSTNFDTVITNAKTFIDQGGDARWDMLVFKHNEHQVEDCKELAYKIGFSKFNQKNSSRFKDNKFEVLNEDGKTIDVLYPTKKSIEIQNHVKDSMESKNPIISCKALEKKELYISANGNVSPCCWLDVEWLPPINEERIDYLNKMGRFPNLYFQSLDDIFLSGFFDEVKDKWNNSSCLKTCKKQCGKFDKLGAQFES